MIYMGSKNRIAKDILPIILKDRKPSQCYVETMVGGANLIDKVKGFRIGADLNPFVIEALKLIRDAPGSLPDHVSEEYYAQLKDKKEINGVTGVIGHTCSFGAKWFGSYAKNKRGDDYSRAAKNNALAQSPNLKDCLFINSSYQFLDIPKESIVYCDPPYEGTAGYEGGFNHSEFWEWVRIKSLEGHSVFVSEYTAPEDFICVWWKEITVTLSGHSNITKATEKLFIYNDLW
jgi:DNA adenine methylase